MVPLVVLQLFYVELHSADFVGVIIVRGLEAKATKINITDENKARQKIKRGLR